MKNLIRFFCFQLSVIVLTFMTSCGPLPTEDDDTTAPTVTVTDPAEASDGIAVNSSVSATFSEEMDTTTIDDSSFLLQNDNGAVAGAVTCSGTIATFTPISELEYDTTYIATINTSATDTAGNAIESDYEWTFTTGVEPDTIAPIPGNSGLLSVSDINKTSITISWTKASDNASPEPDLQYRVYISVNDNISSVQDIEANGTPVNEYTNSINGVTAYNLETGTKYYFNVIVKDASDNKAAYTMLSVSTPKNKTKGILLTYRFSGTEHPSLELMENTLNDLGYLYVKISDTDLNPVFRYLTVDELMEYYAIFYIDIPSENTITLLTSYLSAGGSLYISENDLGYSCRYSEFYQTYLQANYIADNGGDILTGEGLMAGLNLDITGDPYPDAFTVGSEGISIFKYPENINNNIYDGGVAVSRNGYRAIYTAFDFRYIREVENYTTAANLLETITDFLCGEYL